MILNMSFPFCCPIDALTLEAQGSALRCSAGHSFDLAREGYCNLLLVQQKASLNPGDNPEMVTARRRFLEAGYYLPMAQKLVELSRGLDSKGILDAGCGEGYYLGFLQKAFPNLPLAGTDISKVAIKAAAKKYKNISWAVASNKQLPFSPGSVSTILSLFGFPIWESFRKTLAPGGKLLLLDPAPEHLLEMRKIIYPEVKHTELVSVEAAIQVGFSLLREEKLDFTFTLPSAAAIQDLLAMTPHGYRMSLEGRERISKLESLSVRASVVFRVLTS